MTGPAPQTAVIVPIELPEALERLRQTAVPTARLGVPAHVTLLFPFVAAAEVGAQILSQLAAIIGRWSAFDVEFGDTRRFPPSGDPPDGVLWLAPEPAARFVDMIDSLVAAFPAYPPYGGTLDVVIPHLTIATGDPGRHDAIEADIRRSLPIRRRVDRAALLIEDAAGRWSLGERFPLA